MNHPNVNALATNPDARVMVFIDGQNLYQGCRKLFNHPLCHPHLLAEYLAGPRTRHRVACRFYTGRPDHNMPGETIRARNLDRRLAVIQKTGVTVVTRRLRYHWDWGHQQRLPTPTPDAPSQLVMLQPWQRPQEKGIDVALALDVVEFALTGKYDVGIVVSLDRDLCEIPAALGRLRSLLPHPVRLEAAVPVLGDGRSRPKTLTGFQYTHQITADVFELVRDDTRYDAAPENWKVPGPPASLKERRARRDW